MKVLILAGLIVLAACERRAVPPDQQAADPADSVARDSAQLDSVRMDSLRTDSVRADSVQAARTPAVIGHDSAFGPLFAVDSLGRKVELPVRRP